ncbi:unnamed protein product, partial [Phaeothamnion confervicola]
PLIWGVLVVIYLFTASQQIANPDDDFWIHTPLQGLMLHGNFPPFNPFFSEIPMNGHYGRNLSIVTASYLSGVDTFYMQHFMTCLIQMLTFLILALAIERHTESKKQAFLGAFLMYFGINVGGRGGLMDTLQNNNAYVHLYLALCLHLSLSAFRGATSYARTAAQSVLAGAVLGGYAIVYETHFGLTVLAILGSAPLALLARPDRKSRESLLLASLIMLAVATPLAATQGGPITNIVQRKLSGQKEVKAETLSKGMQNQAQVVKLTVPKHNLGQILLERGEYQRISCIYSFDTPLHRFYTPSPGRGYAYILSWDVLKLHFLPLYLAPWTFYFLWKRRNVAGIWLWCWGMISFLVPAIVDFGPIYESEYFRWEFAAGVGLAGALGISLGCLWEESRNFPAGALFIIVVLYLDTLACVHFLSDRVHTLNAEGGWIHKALVLPSTENWLRSHAVLDFLPIDWRAARWLESQVKPGDHLLTNFSQENNFSILFESTLTGVCGARCVGHALPLDDEAIGTTPFHRAAPAAAFWNTGDPNSLDQLLVDWVYYRPTAERPVLDTEGLELVHRETEGGQERQIYRYHRKPFVVSEAPIALPQGMKITKVDAPANARGGQYCPVQIQIDPGTAGFGEGSRLAVVPVQTASGKAPAEVELVQAPLKAGQTTVELPWVSPFEEGKYRLEFLYRTPQGEVTLPSPSAQTDVDFPSWLKQLRIEKVEMANSVGTGELISVSLRVHAPAGTSGRYPDMHVLGCFAQVVMGAAGEAVPDAIHRGELPGDLYQLPGVDVQDITPTPLPFLPDCYLIEATAVAPRLPGRYRIDLFLSPEQGQLYRYPGAEIEVRP